VNCCDVDRALIAWLCLLMFLVLYCHCVCFVNGLFDGGFLAVFFFNLFCFLYVSLLLWFCCVEIVLNVT
jgi:hypothetical protein